MLIKDKLTMLNAFDMVNANWIKNHGWLILVHRLTTIMI